jgi:hypothetical protein
MHGFFPGVFFFAPLFLLFGFFKIVLVVLIIVLIVRLFTHGRHHAAYAQGYGYDRGHDHGYRGHFGSPSGENMDPRRVAAWRFAAGKIDRAEFDHIMSGLDAAAPAATTPPEPTAPGAPQTPPTAPQAPPTPQG